MKKIIKLITEQFAQSINGDGFNSSNGVFKVNYKAYSDLSLAVGRDPDPSLLVKDSVFQMGDIVKGKVRGSTKNVTGEIIATKKATDGKSYIIKIQSTKDKKNLTLVPGSIEFVKDNGNTQNTVGMSISSKEKNAQNLKYNGGNIIWGSMENNTIAPLYIASDDEVVSGPMNTGWKIKFVDKLPKDGLIFNSILADPKNSTMSYSRERTNDAFYNIIKAAEAFCYFLHHPELNEFPLDLKSLLGVMFLELKNELDAKKQFIQYFPELTQRSYGEAKDEHDSKAKTIINSFL